MLQVGKQFARNRKAKHIDEGGQKINKQVTSEFYTHSIGVTSAWAKWGGGIWKPNEQFIMEINKKTIMLTKSREIVKGNLSVKLSIFAIHCK
jgi:hypothetical protein